MRAEKIAITEEIRERLDESGFSILADYTGLKVDGFSDLRDVLREGGSSVLVTKNRLLRVASNDLGIAQNEESLKGATALVTGGEVTQVAKELKKFIKTNGLPRIKGGTLGTQALSADDIEEMASIPSREVLLGQFVGTLAAPMVQLTAVFQQKVLSLVYVLKAIEEKKSAND